MGTSPLFTTHFVTIAYCLFCTVAAHTEGGENWGEVLFIVCRLVVTPYVHFPAISPLDFSWWAGSHPS